MFFYIRGVNDIQLQLWHLKRLCRKYSIDIQEIDNSLTYSENKQHLLSLVTDREMDIRALRSQEEQYMKEHILSHYVVCKMEGTTKSEEVGEPYYPRFSLERFIQQTS